MRPRFPVAVAAALACAGVVSAQVSGTGGGEAEEPTRAELASADAALETVRESCSDVLAALLAELRARCPGIAARQSGGRSKKNDYRNYQWISVKFDDREYLLCTHHNNLDTRTGNPHVQMGRIQFWRCEGPHGPHSRDESGVWRYHFENEDATLPRIRVWDPDFSVSAVADRFLAFLERNGENVQAEGVLQSASKQRTASPDGSTVQRSDGSTVQRPNDQTIKRPNDQTIKRSNDQTPKRTDDAIETIRAVEAKAMAAIVAELRRRHPDWAVRSSHGNSRVNDYRCYQWITIRPDGGEAYWITMMFNDQDPNTGNTHTQFGRIQFWRDIVRGEYEDGSGRKSELGPHTRDAGGWRFRSDKQWASMPRLHLYGPDYSTARVVDLFEEFFEEFKEVSE